MYLTTGVVHDARLFIGQVLCGKFILVIFNDEKDSFVLMERINARVLPHL